MVVDSDPPLMADSDHFASRGEQVGQEERREEQYVLQLIDDDDFPFFNNYLPK